MSAVRTGSRLEQLEALARRLDHEIAQERHRLAVDDRHDPIPVPTRATRATHEPPAAPEGLPALPEVVDTATIRLWAVATGLANPGSRGRLRRHVIAAYYDAHQPAGSAP